HGALPYGDGIAFSSSSLEKIGDALLPAPTDPDADHGGAAGQDAARRDLTTYLPSDLLFKMDRVPMMAGLEVRVPFLNRRVAELALRIPWRHKEKDGSGKAVLKKSLEGFVPATAMTRPKRGFSVPLDSWLWQEGPFRDLVRETLSSTRANRGFVARREIQRMFDEHDRFQAMHGYRLWLLFMLEMWCRNVLDRRPGPDATGPRPGSAPK
ncbi:MAG: hypothetical protein JO102_01815, partial [Elusimicrobia bacterium]|nr:hypothetical protein [Elusimicrobiota bacterium]